MSKPTGYHFSAGQYAIVRVYVSTSSFLVRQYSFSSPPSADYLECTIQREPGGDVTTWLFGHAKVGDALELSQSFGNFTFVPDNRPKLFIAGRVGIAPFMSYLREYNAYDTPIIYSMRDVSETCYWTEIESQTTRIITSEQPRIDQRLLAQNVVGAPVVYICGSRQFAEAIQLHLLEIGVKASDIKRELFTL